MREIKFRGKRKDNGEWVVGYYYSECDVYYIFEDRQKESMLNRNTPHRVIPETIGQYTGLKDKNGVEIYEGDIVERHGSKTYRDIVFVEISARFCYRFKDGAGNNILSAINKQDMAEFFKVIGNIHDNKELLK